MKKIFVCDIAVFAFVLLSSSEAWSSSTRPPHRLKSRGPSLVVLETRSPSSSFRTEATPDSTSLSTNTASATETLTQDLISKLRFRELRRELAHRHLPEAGTTSQLRSRLRQAAGIEDVVECVVNENDSADDCEVSTRNEQCQKICVCSTVMSTRHSQS